MVFDLAYIGYFHASHTQIYNDTVNLTILHEDILTSVVLNSSGSDQETQLRNGLAHLGLINVRAVHVLF